MELLRAGGVLNPNRRVKVQRAEVKDLMLRILLHLPFPGKFRSLWGSHE
jgi:hypothetical protein